MKLCKKKLVFINLIFFGALKDNQSVYSYIYIIESQFHKFIQFNNMSMPFIFILLVTASSDFILYKF